MINSHFIFIQKLTESSLLSGYSFIPLLIISILSIAFIIIFIVLICKSIEKNNHNVFLYFFKNQIPGILGALINYVENFGWIVLGMLITLFIFLVWVPDYFHYILLVFVVGLFLLFPMKFIFSLVSGRNSLRALFFLFIVTQLLFSGIYYIQINKYGEPGKSEGEHADSFNSPDNSQILLNTFYIALIQECSPFFEKYIDGEEGFEELHDKFYVTLNIQIFISWLYLGVLIASLYHKISKR